ncbi:nucleotide exchange factor GrpE [Micrococcales bacterium 31B]|nr:nucleotide exchange factor GrpE [Micrococcales bacterium 31B]
MTEIERLADSIGYLQDLFQRKLMEDRAKNQLIEAVQGSLAAREALDSGAAFRGLFLEALVALDRLETEAATPELARSVHEELLEVFTRRGLSPVAAAGRADPRLHEIVGTEASGPDLPAGHIVRVVRGGYTLGEHLLRPARVVVAVEPGASARPAIT